MSNWNLIPNSLNLCAVYTCRESCEAFTFNCKGVPFQFVYSIIVIIILLIGRDRDVFCCVIIEIEERFQCLEQKEGKRKTKNICL